MVFSVSVGGRDAYGRDEGGGGMGVRRFWQQGKMCLILISYAN